MSSNFIIESGHIGPISVKEVMAILFRARLPGTVRTPSTLDDVMIMDPTDLYLPVEVPKGLFSATSEDMLASSGKDILTDAFEKYIKHTGISEGDARELVDTYLFGGNYYRVENLPIMRSIKRVRFDILAGHTVEDMLKRNVGVDAITPRPRIPTEMKARYTADHMGGLVKRLTIEPNGMFRYVVDTTIDQDDAGWDLMSDEYTSGSDC